MKFASIQIFSPRRKLLIKLMKSFILGLCTSVLSFANNGAFSQNVKIMIDEDMIVTVDEVFKIIRSQTRISFIYQKDLFKDAPKVTLKKGEMSANELLSLSIDEQIFDLLYDEPTLTLVVRPKALNSGFMLQDTLKLEGTVVDEQGSPLPGVTVISGPDESEIVDGVVTSIDGRYEISVVRGHLVRFSYIGYASQKIEIADQQSLDIILLQSAAQLDEVVVVGYGTQKRSEVSAAISTVSAEVLETNTMGVQSFDRGLSGLIKGVQIIQSSGQAGSGVDINIRGITSPFTGSDNNPLFVIDGVPFQTNPTFNFSDFSAFASIENPLLSLNPDDIESVDVLKDAAATAIYGSRGANGVIIVTTKKGRKGEKMNINLSVLSTFARPVTNFDYLSTNEWKDYNARVFQESVDRANINPEMRDFFWRYARFYGDQGNFSEDDAGNWSFDGLNPDYYGTANTDWVDEIFRNPAFTQQYNVTVRGGSTNTSYLVSSGYINQNGLMQNENLKRFNLRSSIDTKIKDFLSVGFTTSLSATNNKTGYASFNNDFGSTLNERPDFPARDEHGNFVRIPGKYFGFWDQFAANPLAKSIGRKNEQIGRTFTGNIYAEAELLKNFKLRTDASVSNFVTDFSGFTPASIVLDYIPAFGRFQSSLAETYVSNTNFIFNVTGNYTKVIDLHTFEAMVGLANDRSSTDRTYFSFIGFPDDEILINNTSAERVSRKSGSVIKSGLNSLFARISYNYGQRYYVTANFRTDKSTKFGPGNQSGYFPSIAASWNLANEPFFKGNFNINLLRLRAGVGRTGSNNLGDFEYKQFFRVETSGDGLYNGDLAVGLTSTLPNLDIQWETNDEVNIGLDFALLNYRLRGSIDVYDRKTTGAIMRGFFPLETGALRFTENFADVSNKGIELEIGGDVLRKNDIVWALNFNISRNINVLDKFNSNFGSSTRFEEGNEVNLIRGYRVEKIFDSQEEIDNLNASADGGVYQSIYTSPGDYKYVDLNGDGVISDADQEILGSSLPDFFGGFNTTFQYRNFELSSFFNFTIGGQSELDELLNGGIVANPRINERRLFTQDRWTPSNTDAYWPSVAYSRNANNRLSDRTLSDRSFLRLGSVILRYTLPTEKMEDIGIDHLSFFISGSNLLTLTSFPGFDPEGLNGGFASGGSTFTRNPYPLAKSWSLGFDLKF